MANSIGQSTTSHACRSPVHKPQDCSRKSATISGRNRRNLATIQSGWGKLNCNKPLLVFNLGWQTINVST
eukprot:15448758-Alexandrium_andersonii.AAC.1